MNIHQLARLSRRLPLRVDAIARQYRWLKTHNPTSLRLPGLLSRLQAGESATRALNNEIERRNIGGPEKRCTLTKKEQRRRGILGSVVPLALAA